MRLYLVMVPMMVIVVMVMFMVMLLMVVMVMLMCDKYMVYISKRDCSIHNPRPLRVILRKCQHKAIP